MLFLVASTDVTLLRCLDILLFEGWEGLVNFSLACYSCNKHQLIHIAVNAVQERNSRGGESKVGAQDVDPSPSSRVAIINAIQDCFTRSADTDAILNVVKRSPKHTSHYRALALDSEGVRNEGYDQDTIASRRCDDLLLDTVSIRLNLV